MSGELTGKACIVTGAARGLGRGMAELFVAEGAQVVIVDLDEAQGAALAAELGPAARFRRADVSQRAEVQALVDYAVSEFGGLHVMVNNAAVSDNAFGRLLDDEFDKFEPVMKVDVLGLMLCTQIAARQMARTGGGSIINISSIGGILSGHGFPIYRAAKAGVAQFTKGAAIELGEHGIRVNCVCPGNVPTDMGTFAATEPGMTEAQTQQLRDGIRDVRLTRQAIKRVGTPLDIAQAVLFFASDRSTYVTGQVLSVDGGATAGDAQSLIRQIMEVRSAATGG
jgi:NAD(P)-dependent dehydrogenase (short-subunit alcohol dehydrogenase family)